MTAIKKTVVYHEGRDAAQRFEHTINRVLQVSKEELARREDVYQKARAHKERPGPRRRSPEK